PGRFVDAKTDGVTISEDGTSAVIAIQPRQNIGVGLRNKASLGSATVAKTVDGEAAGASQIANQTLVLTAFITHPDGQQTHQTLLLSDGAQASIPDLKVGTKGRLSETLPADNYQVTWGDPVFTPGNEITVTQDN